MGSVPFIAVYGLLRFFNKGNNVAVDDIGLNTDEALVVFPGDLSEADNFLDTGDFHQWHFNAIRAADLQFVDRFEYIPVLFSITHGTICMRSAPLKRHRKRCCGMLGWRSLNWRSASSV